MSLQVVEVADRARKILVSIPSDVLLVAAAKGRDVKQVEAAINAGITHIGHNYVQQAIPMVKALGHRATWHIIRHLQRNKTKKVVQHFDMIETVDSWRLAEALDHHCASIGKTMPVLVEINSGREANKTGILPEDLDNFMQHLVDIQYIQVQGLMTMGPRFGDPENARPYFQATRRAFDRLIKLDLPNISMQYLSMGMSNSYLIAIEEGANIVRIGTKIFGDSSNGA